MPKIKYKDIRLRGAALSLIEQSNEILERYADAGYDMTLRQLYYQFVAADLFPDDRTWSQVSGTNKWIRDPNGTKNAEPNYKWLGDVVTDGRLAGLIDWNYLVDRTRNLRSIGHWDSPSSIMKAVADQYAVDKWADQPYRPEVWIEKEALSGVFENVCNELDVPFFACRGYTSLSEMWRAAQRLQRYSREGQSPLILHFGDHDPSGIDMSRDIADRLEMFMGDDVIEVNRLALNMDQVEQYDPPPNPAKITDSRAKVYIQTHGDESWELDALQPDVLAELVRGAIYSARDETVWSKAVKREKKERRTLEAVSSNFADVSKYAQKQGWLRA